MSEGKEKTKDIRTTRIIVVQEECQSQAVRLPTFEKANKVVDDSISEVLKIIFQAVQDNTGVSGAERCMVYFVTVLDPVLQFEELFQIYSSQKILLTLILPATNANRKEAKVHQTHQMSL